jgi:hypothetical protein
VYSSLSWIEWLERLDRVLAGARQDIRALSRSSSPRALAAVEGSARQLSSLTNILRLLDRNVLASAPGVGAANPADNLQRALDTTVLRLGSLADVQAASSPLARDRALAAIDSALRDSCYEAANLLGPRRRRA